METKEKIEDLEKLENGLFELIEETNNEYYANCLNELKEEVKIDLKREKQKYEEEISEEFKSDFDYKNREFREMKGF